MAKRWPVRVPVTMRSENNTPVQTRWCYNPVDPWALAVEFGCDCGVCDDPVSWEFGRDLLAAGLHTLAGLADVQLWPGRGRITLRLSSPDGTTLLTGRRKDLAGVLLRTYGWVAAGEESAYVDVDRAVARVLEEADR